MRCRPISVVAAGEACSGASMSDVRLCDTFSFLICEQGTCVAPASTNEGSSCVRTDFIDGCDAGLYCASQTHVCLKLKNSGDPCTSTEECASGYCMSGSGTCSDTHCD
jgi:Dickkopf N-terminal cysteine-rich region